MSGNGSDWTSVLSVPGEATERLKIFCLEAAFTTWDRLEPHALRGQNTPSNSPGYPTHQRKCEKHPSTVTLSSGSDRSQILAVYISLLVLICALYKLCLYILFHCFTRLCIPRTGCVSYSTESHRQAWWQSHGSPHHVHASIWLEALIFRGQILLQAHPTLWL